jgi:hypothetical protein
VQPGAGEDVLLLALVDQPGDAVQLQLLVALLWLVQSQPQPGTASAKTLDEDADALLGLLLEELLDLFTRAVAQLYHGMSLVQLAVAPTQ